MLDKDKDEFKAMVSAAVGEAKAELNAEALKFVESLEKRFGSVSAAKQAGQNVDFFAREGMGGAKTAPVGVQHKAGRFLRYLAMGRGSLDAAKAIAVQRGDKSMAEMIEATQVEGAKKAMTYSDFTAGGSLVPEEFSAEVIGLLYAKLAITELGCDFVPMPNGNLTIPFLDTGVTAAYVGEAANITPSQQTTGQLQMTAKKLAAVVPISNDLLRTPSAKADAFVQNDLLRRMKVRAEQAFIRGPGAAGEPRGVKSWAVSSNAQSGLTLADKVNDLGKAQRVVEELNVPFESPGYIMAPRTAWGLKQTLDGLGNFVFLKAMEAGVLMGVPYRSSTLVQTTLGAGSDSEIIFGCFAHVLIGDTEQIEISAHPDGAYFDGSAVQAGVSMDVTPMRAIARHDLVCRYRGKEISLITGTTW